MFQKELKLGDFFDSWVGDCAGRPSDHGGGLRLRASHIPLLDRKFDAIRGNCALPWATFSAKLKSVIDHSMRSR